MIPIVVQNGTPYIWNSNDWLTIRGTHHIVGNLIGATTVYPRQDVYNGLPMALLCEEACLLVDEGICELFDGEALSEPPNETIVEEAKTIDESIYVEQAETLKRKRVGVLTAKIDIIAAGKQKHGSTTDPEQLLQQEIDKLVPLQKQYSLVQIPTEYPWEWNRRKLTTDDLLSKRDKTFTKIKLKIYKDLWRRGYYITSGENFGGDYLVYPGDPVKFHAMYIVRCCAPDDVELKPRNIVAFGRLGISVNKITIFAIVTSSGEVDYQSVQWYEAIQS